MSNLLSYIDTCSHKYFHDIVDPFTKTEKEAQQGLFHLGNIICSRHRFTKVGSNEHERINQIKECFTSLVTSLQDTVLTDCISRQ